jgi:hypothetical protein
MGHDKTTTKGESMEWKHPSYYKELKRKRQEEEQPRSRSKDEPQRTDDTQEDGSGKDSDA